MDKDRMQVLSTSEALSECFKSLLARSERVQIVAAWATCGPAIDWIIEARTPSVQAIIGISMAVTDPDTLVALNDRCLLRVEDNPRNAIFHQSFICLKAQMRGK